MCYAQNENDSNGTKKERTFFGPICTCMWGKISKSKSIEEIEKYYIQVAYAHAMQSEDPSTQNGAILVKDGEIIGVGHNQFPKGINGIVKNTEERWNNKDQKYKLVVHAETAAILDAAKKGNSTEGSTMYGCWVSCLDCTRDIIHAGIKELVGHKHQYMTDRPDWNNKINESFKLCEEAGVNVRHIEGKMGFNIRFSGQKVDI